MTRPRPAYRYGEPPPPPEYGRLGRGIRWGLLLVAPLWFLIFMAGFLLQRAIT